MKEFVIESIGDLISVINSLPAAATYWYRGFSNIDYPLVPSIQRNNYMDKEQFLSNDFYMRASVTLQNKPEYKNYSSWLAIMRHYGLPTRLLDWSTSPLISAYFATAKWEDKSDVDGCIWILNPVELNKEEGFQPHLYSIDSHTAREMIRPAFKKDYEPDLPHVVDKILACYPIEHDIRIYVQQSAFTIHNSMKKLVDILDENQLFKIIVPGSAKKNIAKELNILGITLSHIYPDSENIANELKEKYK